MSDCRFNKWNNASAEMLAARAMKLKVGDMNSYVAKEVIMPKNRDAYNAKSGSIIIYKEPNHYTVMFTFGWYCGDVLFQRDVEVKIKEYSNEKERMIELINQKEKLIELINNMHSLYCTEKMLHEIMKDVEEA